MQCRLTALVAILVLVTTGSAGEPLPLRVEATPNIAFEVRVLTVPERFFFERVGVDFEGKQTMLKETPLPVLTDGAILNDSQVSRLFDALQGDPRANVMMAPKVTIEEGQEVPIQSTERHVYTTGVDAVRATGQTVLVPKNTTVDVGLSMKLGGRLSVDRKSVLTSIRFTNTDVADVEMIPILTQAMAVTPDGKNMKGGKPAPFTQYIQSPKIDTVTIEKKDLAIPAGGHAVLVGPAQEREMRQEFGPPMLSKIPYVNRLFKNVGIGRETTRTVLVVTPRVLKGE